MATEQLHGLALDLAQRVDMVGKRPHDPVVHVAAAGSGMGRRVIAANRAQGSCHDSITSFTLYGGFAAYSFFGSGGWWLVSHSR